MINPFENGLLSVDAIGRIINRSGQPITIERQCAIPQIPALDDLETPGVSALSQDVEDLTNQLAFVIIPQIQEQIRTLQETLNQVIACITKAGVLSSK